MIDFQKKPNLKLIVLRSRSGAPAARRWARGRGSWAAAQETIKLGDCTSETPLFWSSPHFSRSNFALSDCRALISRNRACNALKWFPLEFSKKWKVTCVIFIWQVANAIDIFAKNDFTVPQAKALIAKLKEEWKDIKSWSKEQLEDVGNLWRDFTVEDLKDLLQEQFKVCVCFYPFRCLVKLYADLLSDNSERYYAKELFYDTFLVGGFHDDDAVCDAETAAMGAIAWEVPMQLLAGVQLIPQSASVDTIIDLEWGSVLHSDLNKFNFLALHRSSSKFSVSWRWVLVKAVRWSRRPSKRTGNPTSGVWTTWRNSATWRLLCYRRRSGRSAHRCWRRRSSTSRTETMGSTRWAMHIRIREFVKAIIDGS